MENPEIHHLFILQEPENGSLLTHSTQAEAIFPLELETKAHPLLNDLPGLDHLISATCSAVLLAPSVQSMTGLVHGVFLPAYHGGHGTLSCRNLKKNPHFVE